MKQELLSGMYNKSIAGAVVTAAGDLMMQAGVHINELDQIVLDVPTNLAEALVKAAAVAYAIWQITNRPRKTLQLG